MNSYSQGTHTWKLFDTHRPAELTYLCLHFLPLLQIQTVLVCLLVAVELLQLLGEGGGPLAGLLLQAVVLFDLRNSHQCQQVVLE